MEKTDYEKALEVVKNLPRFYLGQEVQTENDGKGIIVDLKMEFNGLYISPERSKAVVWFSTSKAASDGTTWVNSEYKLSEINGSSLGL